MYQIIANMSLHGWKVSIPLGLDTALEGLTRAVLKNQPKDIYTFAAHYFETLLIVRADGNPDDPAHNAGLSPSSTQDSNSKAGEDGEVLLGGESEKEKKTSVSQEKLPEEPQSNDTSYGVEATAVRTLAATTGTVAILGTTAKTGETSNSQTDLTADAQDIELSIENRNNAEQKSSENSNKKESTIEKSETVSEDKEKINVNTDNFRNENASPSSGNISEMKEGTDKHREVSDSNQYSQPLENHVKAEVNSIVENSLDTHLENSDDHKAINSEPLKQTTTALVENIKDDSESSVLVNGEINNLSIDKDDVCSSEDNIDDDERPATVVEIENLNITENECKSRNSISENSGSDDTKERNDTISSEQLKTNSLSDTTLSESFNAELDSVKHSPEATEEIRSSEKSRETLLNLGENEDQNADAIVIENPLFIKNEALENLQQKHTETSITSPPETKNCNENQKSEETVVSNDLKEKQNSISIEEKKSENPTEQKMSPLENILEDRKVEKVQSTDEETVKVLKQENNDEAISSENNEREELSNSTDSNNERVKRFTTEENNKLKKETDEKLENEEANKLELTESNNTEVITETKTKEEKAVSSTQETKEDLVESQNTTQIENTISLKSESKLPEDEEKLAAAATTIQATFRGYQTRQNIQGKENEEIEKVYNSGIKENETLAEKIELKEEPTQNDTEKEKLESAATTIQASFRGYQTRQNIQNKDNDETAEKEKLEKPKEDTITLQEDKNKLENAATTIQATFRGYQTRQNIEKEETKKIEEDSKKEEELNSKTNEDKEKLESAATTIQATFRGYQTRQNIEREDANKTKEESKMEEETLDSKTNENSAATTIQATFRGYQARQNIEKDTMKTSFDSVKEEINPVMNIYIKEKDKSGDSQKIVKSPVSIEMSEGAKTDLLKFDKKENEELTEDNGKLESAATTIQANFRGFQVRKNFDKKDTLSEKIIPELDEKLESAATAIQAGFRGFQTRQKLKDQKQPENESSPLALTPEVIESVKEEVDEICKQTEETTENMIKSGTDALFRAKLGSTSKTENESDTEINDSESESVTETANKTVKSIVEEAEQIADQKMNSAATRIQASFRGFQVRKNFDKTEEPDSIPDFPPSTDEDYLFGTPVLDDDLPPPDFEALESSFSEEVATEPLDIPLPLENLPIPESEEVSEASTEVNDDDLRHLQKPQECDELRKTQDLETSSEGESSLSSAATKIQAGIRGYLTRKHVHNVQGGTGTTSTSGPSIASSDQSLGDLGSSKEEEGPVRSMISEEEETEIGRHRSSPEKSEPKQVNLDKKLSKKRMSLDSRLVVYPPSKNIRPTRAMSVSMSRDDVSNEEVWQTLQQELTTAATRIQSNYRGYRARKQLTRGDAVQMATTSSSATATTTPNTGSLDRSSSQTGAVLDRTSGEYHDMIALTPPSTITTVGEEREEEEDLEEEEKNDSQSREGREKPAGEMTAPATSEDESRMVKRQHTDTKDKDNIEDEDQAASKIQAQYRGYKVRKSLKTEEDKSQEDKKGIVLTPSDMKNQPNESKEPKQQSAKHSSDVENEAAKKIQAGFRGMKTRQELKQKQQNSSK